MIEILIGMISGIVSGTGMGGGNNLNISSYFYDGNRATCVSSDKLNILYSNFNCCNNYKYKK